MKVMNSWALSSDCGMSSSGSSSLKKKQPSQSSLGKRRATSSFSAKRGLEAVTPDENLDFQLSNINASKTPMGERDEKHSNAASAAEIITAA